MHIFDYSFLDEGMLPAEIVNLTSTIAAFNAISGTRKDNNKNIYTELESDLGIASASHGDLTSWKNQGVLLLNNVLIGHSGFSIMLSTPS